MDSESAKFTVLPEDSGRPLLWKRRPEFGPYLRAQREAMGLTLREAASAIGISFTRLQKLETGGRSRAPSLLLLRSLAMVYHQPLRTVLHEAGISGNAEVALELTDGADAFEALVRRPELRIDGMDEAWIRLIGPVQKRQWLEFARRLEQYIQTCGPSLARLLRSPEHGVASEPKHPEHPIVGGEQHPGDALCSLQFFWRPRTDFGERLRAHRLRRALSLRDASAAVGISYSMLQRWETGAPIRPSIPLLWKLAELYAIGMDDLLKEAGISCRTLPAYGLEGQELAFIALMFHPELRPPGMTPQCAHAWPKLLQRQLVEFGWQLEVHLTGSHNQRLPKPVVHHRPDGQCHRHRMSPQELVSSSGSSTS